MTDEQAQYVPLSDSADEIAAALSQCVVCGDPGVCHQGIVHINGRVTVVSWCGSRECDDDRRLMYPSGLLPEAVIIGAPSPREVDGDEREAVARAIRSVPIGPFGPNSLHMLNLGAQTHLNSTEALALADAALSATRPATVSAEAIYEAIAESHPDDRVDPLMESVYRIQANDVVKRLRAAGIEVTE